jgi:hypothetical protein
MENESNLIKEIEEYSSLFMTVDEITILLDLDAEAFRREIRNKSTERAKAYLRGRLKTEVEMRRTTKSFAEKGSPQAEAQMMEYYKRQMLNE